MNGKTETILFPPSDSIHKEPIFYITCKHIHLWYLLVYIIIFGRGRTCPTIQLCSLHCLRGCETYFKAFLQCNHPPSNYLHSLNMNGTRGDGTTRSGSGLQKQISLIIMNVVFYGIGVHHTVGKQDTISVEYRALQSFIDTRHIQGMLW